MKKCKNCKIEFWADGDEKLCPDCRALDEYYEIKGGK